MVSANDPAKPVDEVEVQPPAYGGVGDDKNPIRDGLYILTNKMARTMLDVSGSTSGTRCQGWSQIKDGNFGNQLWVVRKSDGRDTYTLRNFRHAAYLDLLAGKPENGAHVIGHHRVERSDNQEWRLVEHAPNYYTMQCATTNTYLEIPGGNSRDGTKVTCSSPASEKDHQLWVLDRVTVSGEEICAMIERWNPNLLPRLLLPHEDTAEYFVLPSILRRQLWEQTNLQRQPIRPYLFDYDMFVIKSKDHVHSWARDTFPAEIRGYGILFGIIYGNVKKEGKAYNWYLTEDTCSLVFFDPQTGRECSAAALDRLGFEPKFATF